MPVKNRTNIRLPAGDPFRSRKRLVFMEGDRYIYDISFEKKGEMVYISHLDLMALMRRAVRRAELPFTLTKGFTPRVRISMPKALKVGKESLDESMCLWLSDDIFPQRIVCLLNDELPEGIKITGAVQKV